MTLKEKQAAETRRVIKSVYDEKAKEWKGATRYKIILMVSDITGYSITYIYQVLSGKR